MPKAMICLLAESKGFIRLCANILQKETANLFI